MRSRVQSFSVFRILAHRKADAALGVAFRTPIHLQHVGDVSAQKGSGQYHLAQYPGLLCTRNVNFLSFSWRVVVHRKIFFPSTVCRAVGDSAVSFRNCAICGLLLVLANVIPGWGIGDSATVFIRGRARHVPFRKEMRKAERLSRASRVGGERACLGCL